MNQETNHRSGRTLLRRVLRSVLTASVLTLGIAGISQAEAQGKLSQPDVQQQLQGSDGRGIETDVMLNPDDYAMPTRGSLEKAPCTDAGGTQATSGDRINSDLSFFVPDICQWYATFYGMLGSGTVRKVYKGDNNGVPVYEEQKQQGMNLFQMFNNLAAVLLLLGIVWGGVTLGILQQKMGELFGLVLKAVVAGAIIMTGPSIQEAAYTTFQTVYKGVEVASSETTRRNMNMATDGFITNAGNLMNVTVAGKGVGMVLKVIDIGRKALGMGGAGVVEKEDGGKTSPFGILITLPFMYAYAIALYGATITFVLAIGAIPFLAGLMVLTNSTKPLALAGGTAVGVLIGMLFMPIAFNVGVNIAYVQPMEKANQVMNQQYQNSRITAEQFDEAMAAFREWKIEKANIADSIDPSKQLEYFLNNEGSQYIDKGMVKDMVRKMSSSFQASAYGFILTLIGLVLGTIIASMIPIQAAKMFTGALGPGGKGGGSGGGGSASLPGISKGGIAGPIGAIAGMGASAVARSRVGTAATQRLDQSASSAAAGMRANMANISQSASNSGTANSMRAASADASAKANANAGGGLRGNLAGRAAGGRAAMGALGASMRNYGGGGAGVAGVTKDLMGQNPNGNASASDPNVPQWNRDNANDPNLTNAGRADGTSATPFTMMSSTGARANNAANPNLSSSNSSTMRGAQSSDGAFRINTGVRNTDGSTMSVGNSTRAADMNTNYGQAAQIDAPSTFNSSAASQSAAAGITETIQSSQSTGQGEATEAQATGTAQNPMISSTGAQSGPINTASAGTAGGNTVSAPTAQQSAQGLGTTVANNTAGQSISSAGSGRAHRTAGATTMDASGNTQAVGPSRVMNNSNAGRAMPMAGQTSAAGSSPISSATPLSQPTTAAQAVGTASNNGRINSTTSSTGGGAGALTTPTNSSQGATLTSSGTSAAISSSNVASAGQRIGSSSSPQVTSTRGAAATLPGNTASGSQSLSTQAGSVSTAAIGNSSNSTTRSTSPMATGTSSSQKAETSGVRSSSVGPAPLSSAGGGTSGAWGATGAESASGTTSVSTSQSSGAVKTVSPSGGSVSQNTSPANASDTGSMSVTTSTPAIFAAESSRNEPVGEAPQSLQENTAQPVETMSNSEPQSIGNAPHASAGHIHSGSNVAPATLQNTVSSHTSPTSLSSSSRDINSAPAATVTSTPPNPAGSTQAPKATVQVMPQQSTRVNTTSQVTEVTPATTQRSQPQGGATSPSKARNVNKATVGPAVLSNKK